MPVFPDRRMFRIHDPEVTPDSPGGPLLPVGALISTSREQLWVGSLQQDIDVRLVLEEWDGQPLLPDAWEEEAKARLYLRGQVSVDMGSAGLAVQRLRLSGGVGNYEVRVYARYREAVVRMYADLFSQHRDPLSDDFQREKRKLEGVERYLVQLWRDSLPFPHRPPGRSFTASDRKRASRGHEAFGAFGDRGLPAVDRLERCGPYGAAPSLFWTMTAGVEVCGALGAFAGRNGASTYTMAEITAISDSMPRSRTNRPRGVRTPATGPE
jgi:hypothetical protein